MQSTKHLAELVRHKHDVLVQLRELGRRQTDLVASGDVSSLLTLLAAKQKLINALQAIERELTPYYGEDPEHRVWPSAQVRLDCAERISECNAILEEIVQLEKLSAENMTARRNEVAEQLLRVHSSAQVRGDYEAQRRNQIT